MESSTSASQKTTKSVELRRSKRKSVKPSTFSSTLKPKKSPLSKAKITKAIKNEKITVNLQSEVKTIEKNAENTVEFFTIKRLLAHQEHIRSQIASTQERRTNEMLLHADLFRILQRKQDLVMEQLQMTQDRHERLRETAERLNLELGVLRVRIREERGENTEIEGGEVTYIHINEE